MRQFTYLSAVFLLLCATGVHSQPPQRAAGGTISGKVIDSISKSGIEYAEIVLHRLPDSSQITGTISGPGGEFEIKPVPRGNFFVEIHFLGYNTYRSNPLQIGRQQREAQLGDVILNPAVVRGEEVQVEGQRAMVSYQIDKKVIDAGSQQIATSGTAVDILENVPSVTVDIDGNVSLRGSSSFRVLIDGRPSILDANEALQQIPASTIDNIEIITNPSAKYDPEGTSGIINIVMKKNRQPGYSGILNMDGGIDEKYGSDVVFEYKDDRYTFVIGGDYNRRFGDSSDEELNRTTRDNLTSFISSSGNARRGRLSKGLRGSLDYRLTERDVFSAGVRLGDRAFEQDNQLDFQEWSNLSPDPVLYTSILDRERSGDFYALNAGYQHQFPGKGHQLTSELTYQNRNGDEETRDELRTIDGRVTEGQISTEKGPGERIRFKLDYTLPFSNKQKFEAGYQIDRNSADDITTAADFDTLTGRYVDNPGFNNVTLYDRDIHAVYMIYAGERGALGYQAGLRAERTDRTLSYDAVPDDFTIDRNDLFPSAYLSYQFSKGQQMMASYTRRIERPRGYYLEPFETRIDAYNVRRGNPGLQPEYINSFEMGFQTYFGKNLISLEGYLRETTDKIDRVRSVFDDNVTLQTLDNVGKDRSTGLELLFNVDPLKMWNLNLLGNLYFYQVTGELSGTEFDRESFNWNIRLNNSLRFGRSTSFQFNGRYNSPTTSWQGEREGYFSADLSLRHEIIAKVLSATLQVRDVFSSSRFEFTSQGENFLTTSIYEREAPVFLLNIRYTLNNFRQERRARQDDGGGEDEF